MAHCTAWGTGQYAAGEGHVFHYNRLYVGDGTKRPIIWFHQHTGNATSTLQPGTAAYGLDVLAETGHPIIAADLGGPSTWGSDASLARTTDAFNYIIARMGAKSDKALLWGGSMGTLTALLWAKANPTKVAALAVSLPVLNLQDVHDNRTFGATVYGPIIETAYGGAAGYAAALATKNPAATPASWAGVPMKLWYSEDDPVAIPSEVAAFAAASGAQTVSQGAAGHTFNGVDFKKVRDFLTSYA